MGRLYLKLKINEIELCLHILRLNQTAVTYKHVSVWIFFSFLFHTWKHLGVTLTLHSEITPLRLRVPYRLPGNQPTL